MIFDPVYIVAVLIPTLAITGWATWRVKSTYGKWSKVDSGINLDAFDFARGCSTARASRASASSRRRAS